MAPKTRHFKGCLNKKEHVHNSKDLNFHIVESHVGFDRLPSNRQKLRTTPNSMIQCCRSRVAGLVASTIPSFLFYLTINPQVPTSYQQWQCTFSDYSSSSCPAYSSSSPSSAPHNSHNNHSHSHIPMHRNHDPNIS